MTQKETYIELVKQSPKNASYYKPNYIKKYFPEVYDELSKNNFSKEFLYYLIYNENGICQVCGKHKTFKGMVHGYKECCVDSGEDPYELLNLTDANKFRESYIRGHYHKFYDEIMREYDENIPWRERLYLKLHHMILGNISGCGKRTHEYIFYYHFIHIQFIVLLYTI